MNVYIFTEILSKLGFTFCSTVQYQFKNNLSSQVHVLPINILGYILACQTLFCNNALLYYHNSDTFETLLASDTTLLCCETCGILTYDTLLRI